MDRAQLIKALRDTAQSASNAIAGSVSGPVDLITAALRAGGLNIERPIGGSEWMNEKGLTIPVEMGAPRIVGETLGIAGPAVVAAKAPQIASAINRGVQNLAAGGAPAMRGQMGGVYMGGPRQEALETAQRNAAKPVSEGGLGLPPNNTPMDRARAMGFEDDAVHFSRHGIDATELDSGKFAIAPFDAVGTHVGTKEAAMDRFKNTVGTTPDIKGTSYPVLIKRGEQFVSSRTGGAWTEEELSAALFERGGYANAKDNFQSLNQKLRRDLFRGSGYDSIPYVNDVESKGSVSYIVPPHNIRSRFAAFDPARVNENDLLGRADPRLLGLMGLGAAGGLGAYNYMQGQ